MSAPIKVYQCKDDCCLVQVPSRRFWITDTAGVKTTLVRFTDAIGVAAHDAELLRRAAGRPA